MFLKKSEKSLGNGPEKPEKKDYISRETIKA
jgi:hypothetical protein